MPRWPPVGETKSPLVIIGALMTKLLHWIYGILKAQKPFNPDHHVPSVATA